MLFLCSLLYYYMLWGSSLSQAPKTSDLLKPLYGKPEIDAYVQLPERYISLAPFISLYRRRLCIVYLSTLFSHEAIQCIQQLSASTFACSSVVLKSSSYLKNMRPCVS